MLQVHKDMRIIQGKLYFLTCQSGDLHEIHKVQLQCGMSASCCFWSEKIRVKIGQVKCVLTLLRKTRLQTKPKGLFYSDAGGNIIFD